MQPPDDLRVILDAFRHIVQTTRAFSTETEEKLGITGAQLFALQTLARFEPLSVNQLAERTHTHQSSVSVVARRLVEKGLVSKRTSSEDGRRVELMLSSRGRALAARTPEAVQDRIIEAVRSLTSVEQGQLAHLLTRVVEHLEPSRQTPPMFYSDQPDSHED